MSGETEKDISGWSVDTLKESIDRNLTALREVMDERDRLYKERDESRRTAVDAALTAVKEQTKGSFEASEKAIVKAEEAQKAYNQSHNDLARKMDDQNKATMPRSETEARLHAVGEKVNAVASIVARIESKGAGMRDVWGWVVAGIAILFAALPYIKGAS